MIGGKFLIFVPARPTKSTIELEKISSEIIPDIIPDEKKPLIEPEIDQDFQEEEVF